MMENKAIEELVKIWNDILKKEKLLGGEKSLISAFIRDLKTLQPKEVEIKRCDCKLGMNGCDICGRLSG